MNQPVMYVCMSVYHVDSTTKHQKDVVDSDRLTMKNYTQPPARNLNVYHYFDEKQLRAQDVCDIVVMGKRRQADGYKFVEEHQQSEINVLLLSSSKEAIQRQFDCFAWKKVFQEAENFLTENYFDCQFQESAQSTLKGAQMYTHSRWITCEKV